MKKIDLKPSGIISILEYAALVISGCIFVLVSASWTSPLFPEMYGYDSAWYSMMGRAITEGCVPYRDYFDLKGPVFFFIEAIGQALIKGRNGIFLIECIASALSSVFIYRSARLFLSRVRSFVILFIYYFVYVFLLWGGNTCEEYMMTFDFACIYLFLHFIKGFREDKDTENAPAYAFFFGLSFGIMALSKITVAAPVLAATVTVIFLLIKEKRAGIIPRLALMFFFGMMFIAVPVCLYFVFHGAFKDFLYCAFEFAFKRSTDYYESFSLEWERNLSICIAGLITGLLLKREEALCAYRRIFLMTLSVITYLALHLGTPYTYYFITELPVLVMLLIEAMDYIDPLIEGTLTHNPIPPALADEPEKEILDKKLRAKSLYSLLVTQALICMILFMYAVPVYDKLSENLMYFRYPGDSYFEGCIDTWEFIPFYEREEVYNLESGMIIYEINKALPANKYPVNLPYFLHLDPAIKQNVLAYLEVKKPKWIISEKMEDFDDEDIRDFVFTNYELKRQTNSHEIYRIRK